MNTTWKAALELFALLLIYAGTLVITLGGVPALIEEPVTFNGQSVTFDGQPVTFGHTSSSQTALRRYMRWAVPGLILIALGMIWQAVGPCNVLLDAARKAWGYP